MWNFSLHSNKIAAIDDLGNKISYRELDEEGKKIASIISDRKLVFVLCQNKIASVLGYTACVNNGIVPLLLNAHLEKELMLSLLNRYKPSFVWLPEDIVCDYDTIGNVIYETRGYSLIKTGFNVNYNLNPSLCLLLTTSGSTGSPKLVRQSYINVESNARSIVQYLKLSDDERPITTLPMNYTYGLSIINSHLLVGATLLITEKGFMQKEFWLFFKKEAATSFGGVPYTYEMLNKLRFYRMELPSLKYMTQAGGKLTYELHKAFAEYANDNGKKFIVMYGQCEATARMGYLPSDKSLEKCGSMGIPIPGGRFYLINENEDIIDSINTVGELVYEGPNVTLGYAEDIEDLAKGDERNGILKTGDMAQCDEDGYFYIVGRKKRFLKIYGNRVNIDEIDRLVKEEYNIEFACAGVDDHMYLFITDSALEEQIKNYVVLKTKLNPSAFKTIVIEDIPKNDAGKVLYKELEKFYR